MNRTSCFLPGAAALALFTFSSSAGAHAAPANASLAAADFDGDGRADLAFTRPDGSWAMVPTLRGGADGWLAATGAAPSWANQKGARAVLGDFNGDKRTDLAFVNPGSGWTTVPVLLSAGGGAWTAASYPAPPWANATDSVAVAGDFNGDKRTDLAFFSPGSAWTTVPVLLANGAGWTATNYGAPAWAHQPDVIALAGDFDGDGKSDLAFHRPGGGWKNAPLLISKGDGNWTAYAPAAPSWVGEPGTLAVSGDFDGDGRSDLAFTRPGSTWTSVPVLRGNGASWLASSAAAPAFANAAGAQPIVGDFNGDGRADLVFHRADGVGTQLPLLFGTGGSAAGSWTSGDATAPSWALRPGTVALAGDFNGDGRADLALQRADGETTTISVLRAPVSGGAWTAKPYAAPAWANQLGARPLLSTNRGFGMIHPGGLVDVGDPAYDVSDEQRHDWDDEVQAWLNFLRLFVRIVQGYDEYVRQSGLNGQYDGSVSNGRSSAAAYLELSHHGAEVHGRIIVKQATLRLDGGICSDVTVPVSVLQVNAATVGGSYHAAGATTRTVRSLGIFTGSLDISFDFTLETTTYTHLSGSIDLDVPWPCANQSLTFHFARRTLL